MHEYRTEVVIAAQPAEVFAFLADLGSTPLWMPEITGLEVLGDGPVGAGTVFRETRMVRGKECSTDITVSEHRGPDQGDPPYRHAVAAKTAGVLCTYAYELQPAPTGTRIELLATAEPKSFFGKLVAKAMLGFMIKADGDQLERLRAAMEERNAD